MPVTPPTPTTEAVSPGEAAYTVGLAQLGKPYRSGGVGPDAFDCSGFVQYCYQNGPNIAITRTTLTQWQNNTTLNTIYDVYSTQETQGFNQNQLQVGDLIYYFADSNSGNSAHVVMYAGNGQVIEAPHTGDVVKITGLQQSNGYLTDSNDPLRGVKRAVGGLKNYSLGSDSGNGNGNNPSNVHNLSASDQANMIAMMKKLKDPDNNLPFSAAFQGQALPNSVAGGSMLVPKMDATGRVLYPNTNLVRGGIGELMLNRFKCYFMMNPSEIDVSVSIVTDHQSPFQMPADQWQSGGFGMSGQTVTFTLWFNRMYEVWQGNVHNPKDGSLPGPSGGGLSLGHTCSGATLRSLRCRDGEWHGHRSG